MFLEVFTVRIPKAIASTGLRHIATKNRSRCETPHALKTMSTRIIKVKNLLKINSDGIAR